MDYSELAAYCDWIKPVVYHDIAGPRLRALYLERMKQTILRDISIEQSLALFYAFMGYDPTVEPRAEELYERGFSSDYVYRETKRCVTAVQGRVPVYPGIGFDIPWQDRHFPGDPEDVYRATLAAFDAGASGIVVSREYHEMRVDNLRAVGRAVREASN
jgi:hypothetical protein